MDEGPEDPRDTRVGYSRPPKASQFKKGQSGNPRGRPPKSRGHKAIASRVFHEMQRLSGQPQGARIIYKTLELIVMTLKQLAVAGRSGASTLYLRYTERYAYQRTPQPKVGFLVVPERLTEEEWDAMYAPKGPPPSDVPDFD